MAQAARVHYDYYSSTAAQRAPRHEARPDIRVIPGRRSENPALRGLSPVVFHAFFVVVAVILLIALAGFARVALSAATVENLERSQALSSRLEAAQATGNELEIRHSMLASTSRIKSEAKALGLVKPSKVTYLDADLSGVPATNSDGTVALAETLGNIAASNASSAR